MEKRGHFGDGYCGGDEVRAVKVGRYYQEDNGQCVNFRIGSVDVTATSLAVGFAEVRWAVFRKWRAREQNAWQDDGIYRAEKACPR